MSLIGIQDSLIERNHIDSPVRASIIARPNDEADRQAILLRHCTRVELEGNTLTDSENHTQPDPTSGSPLVGLEATKDITLDGKKIPDVQKKPANSAVK
jgi:hypothetical protein